MSNMKAAILILTLLIAPLGVRAQSVPLTPPPASERELLLRTADRLQRLADALNYTSIMDVIVADMLVNFGFAPDAPNVTTLRDSARAYADSGARVTALLDQFLDEMATLPTPTTVTKRPVTIAPRTNPTDAAQ